MSEDVPAVTFVTKKPIKVKLSKSKKPSSKSSGHPPFSEMVTQAIQGLGERRGSTRIAIKKWVINHFHLEDDRATNMWLNKSLKKGVDTGKLVTAKGHSGTFRTVKGKNAPAAAAAATEKKKNRKSVTATSKKVTLKKKKVAVGKKSTPKKAALIRKKAAATTKVKAATPAKVMKKAKSPPKKVVTKPKAKTPVKKAKTAKK